STDPLRVVAGIGLRAGCWKAATHVSASINNPAAAASIASPIDAASHDGTRPFAIGRAAGRRESALRTLGDRDGLPAEPDGTGRFSVPPLPRASRPLLPNWQPESPFSASRIADGYAQPVLAAANRRGLQRHPFCSPFKSAWTGIHPLVARLGPRANPAPPGR